MTDPREQDEQERELIAKVAEWPKLLDPRTPAELEADERDEREVRLRCDLSASRRAHRRALRWVSVGLGLSMAMAAMVGFYAARATSMSVGTFALVLAVALFSGGLIGNLNALRLSYRDEP